MVTSSLGPYVLAPGRSWPPGRDESAEGTAPDGRRVVLRRASPAFVAVVSSMPHPHLLQPVDVLADDDGALVVVSAEPGGERLDTWARRRGTMSAGEAVTVLLPVLAAVSHLARRGAVLGGIGLQHVVIDDRGAPVLVGGVVAAYPVRRPPTPGRLPPETVPEGARTFVEALALQLSPHDRDELLGSEGIGTNMDELVELVHDLAAPVALPTTTPGSGVEEASVVWRPPPGEPPRSGWTSALPESALLDGLADWWEAVSAVPIVERLRAVRPRSWALGGLVAVSLVIGVALVPDGASPDVPTSDASGLGAPAPDPDPDPGLAHGPATSPTATATATASRTDEASVRGDDAAAATAVLLRARIDCVREPSTSCLAAVDQAGSPVAGDDARVLDDPASTDGLVLPVRVESEVQRLGETVLLACRTADDEPASVLVVRTEAGWRLREVLQR
ncbi:hypothetical protein [Frigoribacterium sp. PvP032]|uniref:hypothetical protein n=1 Tax=Frigoribacterium sp. PvP032 TaxID=2806589 RepID=UPI001AE4E9B0|nr:hypothetical protein [Frigoribacterium sp. PvP032]MBP1190696.1 hypothetical protein [Frigoribacterium sp. PvP032]